MKIKLSFIYCFFLMLLISCGEADTDSSTQSEAMPTIDSNTVEPLDTIPDILHLDNPSLDSTPIVLDEPSQTIYPKDTNYKRSGKKN
jgi:hypothetical protein